MNPNDEKLAQFAEDDVMFYAVRSIVFSYFDANTLETIPRTERDAATQAVFDGRIKLQEAFKNLQKFKREQSTPGSPINNAV